MRNQKISPAELEKLLSIQQAYQRERELDETPFAQLLNWMETREIDQARIAHRCEAGEIVIREGEPGDEFYLIRSGEAAVLKGSLKAPTVLGFRIPGDAIGEMALLENLPRSATVVALTPMSLWCLGRDLFYEFLIENPQFSLKLMNMLSWRIRESADELLRGHVREKRQTKELQDLSEKTIRDPLTGLFNRRYLDETLREELLRALQYNHPLGVMMIDVDFFKKVNDTYGHQTGDIVLQQMAGVLKACVRAEDSPCRYGGEEFAIVMPGASAQALARSAEEIRMKVQALSIHYAGHEIQVTVSVGIAVFPADGGDGLSLLTHADAALYRAKRDGRNCVKFYASENQP